MHISSAKGGDMRQPQKYRSREVAAVDSDVSVGPPGAEESVKMKGEILR